MIRTIGAASVLCLGLLLPPAWAAPAAGDDQMGEFGAANPPPALAPGDTSQSMAVPTELAAFLQCKTACAPRCETHAENNRDLLQAERCQQACELRCNGIGGK